MSLNIEEMNTTAVNIRKDLYNHAAEYARRHDTSIDSMVENYFLAIVSLMPLDDRDDITNPSSNIDKKSMEKREAWQKRPISEKTKRLLPKRRTYIPEDYKPVLEQRLRKKYESIS